MFVRYLTQCINNTVLFCIHCIIPALQEEVLLFNTIIVLRVLSDDPIWNSLFLHIIQDAGETGQSLEGACIDNGACKTKEIFRTNNDHHDWYHSITITNNCHTNL